MDALGQRARRIRPSLATSTMALASNASGQSTRVGSSAFRRVPPLAPRAGAPALRCSNRVERARRVVFRQKVDSDAARLRGRAAHLARAASSDDATPPAAAEQRAAGWCDEDTSECDASASWDEDPAIDLEMSPAEDGAPDAWWVSLMNEGLDSDPGWTLVAFFICDLGSAMVLFALYTVAQVNVDADFVLAYALAKGPLRAPRLALDAVVAADMTRRWPQLARVRVTSLIDAGTDALARFKRFVDAKVGGRSDAEEGVTGGTAAVETGARESSRSEAKQSAGAKLAAEARSLTDKYGLAYMAAKNIIGPVTMVIFYVALKSGIDVQALLERALGSAATEGGAAAAAGAAAGRVCLSSFTSTALFPWVVLGAGALGPVLGRAARGLKSGELSKAE